jgi:hypothetical protein
VQNVSKDTTSPLNGLAQVFLINPDIGGRIVGKFLRNVSIQPIPPKAFAINSNLVAVMPYPSYTKLALQPGSYEFYFATYHEDFIQVHNRKSFSFEANTTYFVRGYYTIFSNELDLLHGLDGYRAVEDFPLAKTIHQIIPIDVAKERVIWNKAVFSEKFPSQAGSSKNQSSTTTSSAVITSANVSDFFAAVGALALVALTIFGLGAASVSPMPTLPPPSAIVMDPPAHTLSVPSIPTSVRSASGRTMLLEQTQGTGTIYNVSTGVRYRIEGDNIIGTDGSRFRSAGSTIFSNNGNYYTRSGNTITSNDGRQCQIIGSLIDCK